jgi:Tfp pilus assembly protein PilX
MKCRTTIESLKRNQNGIALVITLVMLAIVTVMAIVFLAITRRERSSVKVTEETAIAKDMADAALERVKTEVMSKMNANGSKLHYDIFNSQAFFNKGKNASFSDPIGGNGFTPNVASPTNVAHAILWRNIQAGSQADYLRMLANLQYDPAVPVFVETTRNGPLDFRYYLDFNRNRQFETNFFGYGRDENFRTNGTPGLARRSRMGRRVGTARFSA